MEVEGIWYLSTKFREISRHVIRGIRCITHVITISYFTETETWMSSAHGIIIVLKTENSYASCMYFTSTVMLNFGPPDYFQVPRR